MPATDDFVGSSAPLGDCYANAAAVTTSDSVDLGHVTRAIYVGVAGDVTAVVNGTAVLFKAMPVGTHRIRASRINATATTATNIVALW